MASPRKHPSLYPSRLTDLLLGPAITLYLPNHRAAINLRYRLYAFREALREHPDYNDKLLHAANDTTLVVLGLALFILKGDTS